MEKKQYVSPRYELLKFDSRIVTNTTSGCSEAIVAVVYHQDIYTDCKTTDTTTTMWNDEW